MALVAMAAVLLMMSFFQSQMLFPTDAVPAAGRLPAGAEKLEIEASGGVRLHGVYFQPRSEGDNPLVLGFGGNAWNGQHVAVQLNRLFPVAHVVAFHYRGYRPSTGSPSSEALIADSPLVYDAADNVVASVDGRGNRTTVAYDALDRPTQTTNALGGLSTLGYDAADNLVSVKDERGNTTTYGYDRARRPVSTTDALNRTTTLVYSIYEQAFANNNSNYGYASAQAMVLLVIVLLITAVQFGVLERRVFYR